jgi:hypothetical protein
MQPDSRHAIYHAAGIFGLRRRNMQMLPRMLGLLLFLIPAGAIPAGAAASGEIEARAGPAIICDTPVQIERFIALSNSGVEMESALQKVNDEVRNPTACGIALVMFTHGQARDHKVMQGKSIDIVEITIHAFGDGQRWTPVPATQQYTVLATQGLDV